MAQPPDKTSKMVKAMNLPLLFSLIIVTILLFTLLSAFHVAASHVSRIYAALALTGLVVAAALIATLHTKVVRLNPLLTMVSEYALDWDYGWMMHSAFFLIGAGAIWLAIATWVVPISSLLFPGLLAVAGVFAAAMGYFSMKSRTPDEMPSPPESGKKHDRCVLFSFGAGTVSMFVFAAAHGNGVLAVHSWLHAVGMMQFHITLLGVIFFAILGGHTRNEIKHQTGTREYVPILSGLAAGRYAGEATAAIVGGAVGAALSAPAPGGSGKSGRARRRGAGANNYGQGVVERILIFLFIEWGFFLSLVMIKGS